MGFPRWILVRRENLSYHEIAGATIAKLEIFCATSNSKKRCKIIFFLGMGIEGRRQ